MSVQQDLHAAHKARKLKLWGKPPQRAFARFLPEVALKQALPVYAAPEALYGTMSGTAASFRMEHGVQLPKRPPSWRAIVSMVAKEAGVSVPDILGRRRWKPVCEARQVVMYLTRYYKGSTYPEIGRFFGGYDHSTIINGVQRVERNYAKFEPLINRVVALMDVPPRWAEVPFQ